MIESQIDTEQSCGHIVLCPNMSARWRTTKLFLFIVSFYALAIGAGFAALGLWLILPFAGLEVLALLIIMYRVARKCARQEVIVLDRHEVRLERGYSRPAEFWRSELFWTRLIVQPPGHKWHHRRVYLRGKNEQVEIGAFLNDHEKQKLIQQLRNYIPVI